MPAGVIVQYRLTRIFPPEITFVTGIARRAPTQGTVSRPSGLLNSP